MPKLGKLLKKASHSVSRTFDNVIDDTSHTISKEVNKVGKPITKTVSKAAKGTFKKIDKVTSTVYKDVIKKPLETLENATNSLSSALSSPFTYIALGIGVVIFVIASNKK